MNEKTRAERVFCSLLPNNREIRTPEPLRRATESNEFTRIRSLTGFAEAGHTVPAAHLVQLTVVFVENIFGLFAQITERRWCHCIRRFEGDRKLSGNELVRWIFGRDEARRWYRNATGWATVWATGWSTICETDASTRLLDRKVQRFLAAIEVASRLASVRKQLAKCERKTKRDSPGLRQIHCATL